MSNSQQKQILAPRKQYNTQNPTTPHKKTPIPPPTPNNHSISSNQKSMTIQGSSGTVSYAQLQIILENVQQVKKKTNEQINILQKKNQKLQEDYRQCKDQLRRYQNIEQTIIQQKASVQLRFHVQLKSLKQQIERKQKENRLLLQQIQQFKQKIRQQAYQMEKYTFIIQKHKEDYLTSENRYKKLTQILNINESSHELKIIKQQYTDIPHLLQCLNVAKLNTSHQIHLLEDQKISNQQLKQQISNNNKVINNITEENRHLLKVLQQLNTDKQNLLHSLSLLQLQKSQFEKQNDKNIHQMQEQILHLRRLSGDQILTKDQTIQLLKQKIHILENKLLQAQYKQKAIKQQAQFKSIVEQVCNQYEDYDNVMKRISYLQKYRSEHYFNIEKIQYLCKILDS